MTSMTLHQIAHQSMFFNHFISMSSPFHPGCDASVAVFFERAATGTMLLHDQLEGFDASQTLGGYRSPVLWQVGSAAVSPSAHGKPPTWGWKGPCHRCSPGYRLPSPLAKFGSGHDRVRDFRSFVVIFFKQ